MHRFQHGAIQHAYRFFDAAIRSADAIELRFRLGGFVLPGGHFSDLEKSTSRSVSGYVLRHQSGAGTNLSIYQWRSHNDWFLITVFSSRNGPYYADREHCHVRRQRERDGSRDRPDGHRLGGVHEDEGDGEDRPGQGVPGEDRLSTVAPSSYLDF